MNNQLNGTSGVKKNIVKVVRITLRQPETITIIDQWRKERKLHKTDFDPSDWERIREGSQIEVTTQVMGIKVLPDDFPKIFHLGAIPVPGYLWICSGCKRRGVAGYEDGDDPQKTLSHICEAHQKASPKCASPLRIFDHNFMEMLELEKIATLKPVS